MKSPRRFALALALTAGVAAAAAAAAPPDIPALEAELRATETAFAKTMADRDLAAFATFLAPETIWHGGGEPLRGSDAVLATWQRFFVDATPPFTWEPRDVTVLATGDLGLTTGPVFGPDGKQIATFSSIWRHQPDGRWLIVFDRGCDYCD